MFLLDKNERADPIYGRQDEIITDEMIEALKKGRRLYIDVQNEYAVVIKYKGKNNGETGNSKENR